MAGTGVLGGLIAWTAYRSSQPPLWVGIVLLAWLVVTIGRVPGSGFWFVVPAPVLLLLDRAI